MMTEIEKLEQEYCAGKFKILESELTEFIKTHKESIKQLKDDELGNIKGIQASDELAIKLFILKSRSINPTKEIKIELDEIEKEVWYQGEKRQGQIDRNKIAEEWCKKHAAGWRDNWILGALLVFERDKQKFVNLLNS
ncbi:MAG: hypothetical protein HY811_05550 [Planctomycetes bacterium]|nr:hypothetical protein [Planctomycetota bacterium]